MSDADPLAFDCGDLFEILLEEPESSALDRLAMHAETCAKCSIELSAHRALLTRLRGEDGSAKSWHPSAGDLLIRHQGGTPVERVLADRIDMHLEACAPCHDAYLAFECLAPESRRVS